MKYKFHDLTSKLKSKQNFKDFRTLENLISYYPKVEWIEDYRKGVLDQVQFSSLFEKELIKYFDSFID